MWLVELMNAFIEAIVPPPDADHAKQYVYRLRVTLVACTAFIGLAVFIAASMGWLPWFGGFAKADDVGRNVASEHRFWAQQIDADILQLRERQCAASSSEAKQLYWERISRDINEWQRLSDKSTYPMPTCADLGDL